MKIIKYIILLLISTLFLVNCSKNETDVLNVATYADFPPFEYYENGESGNIIGFDIDLINLIARKMNKKVKLVEYPMSTILVELSKGKVDLVIYGLTITDERKKQINFSIPYFNEETILVVKNNNNTINSFKDLENKKIGVELGSSQDMLVQEKFKNSENIRFKDVATAILNLSKNKVDAVIIDKTVAKTILKDNKDLKILSNLVIDKSPFGIAINKNNLTLLQDVNYILNQLLVSKEIDNLKKKWNID